MIILLQPFDRINKRLNITLYYTKQRHLEDRSKLQNMSSLKGYLMDVKNALTYRELSITWEISNTAYFAVYFRHMKA